MNTNYNSFEEIFGSDFLKGFKQETKKEVTEKYIKGLINKDEFMQRMKKARN